MIFGFILMHKELAEIGRKKKKEKKKYKEQKSQKSQKTDPPNVNISPVEGPQGSQALCRS